MQNPNTVLIAGGGLVGLLAARLLAEQGLEITIVEPTGAPARTTQTTEALAWKNPRVYALSPATIRLLSSIGLKDGLLAGKPCPFHSMEIWDGEGTGRIQINAEDAGQTELGNIVHHDILAGLLMDSLKEQAGVELLSEQNLCNLDFEDNRLKVEVSSGRVIEAGLLIGADGTQSKTRELAGLPVHQWSNQQTALVAAVELASEHGNRARQVFVRRGCIGILPVGIRQPKRVVIVWSAHSDQAEQIASSSVDEFSVLLAKALEVQPEQIVKVGRREQFPLNSCYARKWFKDSLVLVGDAAHTSHPLIGQGLNLGFEDAAWLAHLIAQRKPESRHLVSTGLLARYQYRRMIRTSLMTAFAETLRFGFAQQTPVLALLRNRAFDLGNRSTALSSLAVKVASGDLPESLWRTQPA